MLNINNTRKLSIAWKDICRPLSNINKFHKVVRSSFGVLIGDGKLASFWDDEWIDGFILRIKFLIIYTLVCKKTRIMSEFGAWVEECWQWFVNLRKNLFDWEISQGNEFFNLINATTLSRER